MLNLGTSVYPFEDVTDLVDAAAKDMEVGELVQVPSFSLFDAMCAIVIMDPKMDTGMIMDDTATGPVYNINRRVSPTEFIWIFDNILIGQMTWLSGHALSQTLFTSCHILRLLEINQEDDDGESSGLHQDPTQPPRDFLVAVLKSCVLAIAKSCALIWSEMRKGQVYEEEDFMTNKFGVSMFEDIPTASLVAMLDQAEYWMESEGQQWIKYHCGSDAGEVLKGVMERIDYCRSSYMALFQVIAPKCSQYSQAGPQLEAMQTHISGLKATHALGTKVEGAFDHTIHRQLVANTPPRAIALLTFDETIEQLAQMCTDLMSIGKALPFTSSANLVNFFILFGSQKPAPGAFPRSILQTVLYEERIIMGSRKVDDVVRESIQETVSPVTWIFDNFDTLQTRLGGAGNTTPASESHVLATIPELAEDSISAYKMRIQTGVVMFVEKATKPFVDTLHIMGQNTSRQRRNLRKIVQLWETLQEQAEVFDADVHAVLEELRVQHRGDTEEEDQEQPAAPFYFVSWVYHMKLWVMEWLLLLGSELELYSPFEYSMVYAYVDSVLGAHAQHLQRIRSIIESEVLEPEPVDPPLAKETSEESSAKEASELKKKKKKKKKPSNASSAVSTTEKVIEYAKPTRTILMWQFLTSVKMQLTRGVFLVLASLTKAGHLTTTPPHIASHGMNNLEMLFAHRFKAFRLLSSPEALPFDNFLSRLECDGLDSLAILNYATDYFSEAQRALEQLLLLSAAEAQVLLCEDAWRKDIMNMIKVCIASKIGIVGLQKDARMLEFRKSTLEAQKRKLGTSSGGGPKLTTAQIKASSSTSKTTSVPVFKAPVRKVVFEWKYHAWWPVITLAPPPSS
ncbi:hypothetical protein BGZ96_001964 [Linnemannia gamsii]|uniref:Mak10-domain-containing protein n=1 Tax=Linnemannia gamsii TaxID=64522 RepID=A0ABQ7KA13_9FUNG|nr:hypothetical protein BGZ96_001964 [Linnemannia gamsii]